MIFSVGTILLLLNVVRFFFLNIFNLANIYLSSRIGLAVNFNFKRLLTTFHISSYFSQTSLSSVTNDIFFPPLSKYLIYPFI